MEVVENVFICLKAHPYSICTILIVPLQHNPLKGNLFLVVFLFLFVHADDATALRLVPHIYIHDFAHQFSNCISVYQIAYWFSRADQLLYIKFKLLPVH